MAYQFPLRAFFFTWEFLWTRQFYDTQVAAHSALGGILRHKSLCTIAWISTATCQVLSGKNCATDTAKLVHVEGVGWRQSLLFIWTVHNGFLQYICLIRVSVSQTVLPVQLPYSSCHAFTQFPSMNNSTDFNKTFSCDASMCCNRRNANYLVVVGYPILLLSCIMGNTFTSTALIRCSKFRVREVLIVSMGTCDLIAM